MTPSAAGSLVETDVLRSPARHIIGRFRSRPAVCPRCHEGRAPARGRHGSRGSPKPRLDACRLVASDWVDAEVSSTPDLVLDSRILSVSPDTNAGDGEFRFSPTSSPSGSRGIGLRCAATKKYCGPGLGLAFPRRRLSLPFRAWFGSQSSARGRVDALVAIVPADAIPRRGVAAQHFLNDTGAGSAAR